MNQAKRLKVEEEKDFSSESSSDDENNFTLGDENEVLNIEFEGLSLSDEDYNGIRQLLLQLFTENEKTINISEFTKALIAQNIVGTVLKQVQEADDEADDDIYALVTCFSLTRPKTDLTTSIRKFFTDKCVPSQSPLIDKKTFAKAFTELTEDRPNSSGALGLIISERFINVPPQAVKPMYQKLVEEIKEAATKEHGARFDFTHYIMITKICAGFRSAEKKDASDEFYINAEEELFAEEATAKFQFMLPGNMEISKRRVFLIPSEGFNKCVSKLKDDL